MIASPMLQLPEDIRWHFIGHLQSNKVKPLLGSMHKYVTLVHTIGTRDSRHLIYSLQAAAYK